MVAYGLISKQWAYHRVHLHLLVFKDKTRESRVRKEKRERERKWEMKDRERKTRVSLSYLKSQFISRKHKFKYVQYNYTFKLSPFLQKYKYSKPKALLLLSIKNVKTTLLGIRIRFEWQKYYLPRFENIYLLRLGFLIYSLINQ